MHESKESLKSDDLLLKFNFKCNKEKHFQNEKNKIVSSLTLFPFPHAKGNENNFHASIISLMPLSQTYFEQFFLFVWMGLCLGNPTWSPSDICSSCYFCCCGIIPITKFKSGLKLFFGNVKERIELSGRNVEEEKTIENSMNELVIKTDLYEVVLGTLRTDRTTKRTNLGL